jgi:cysteinyl-tRNA synthetase
MFRRLLGSSPQAARRQPVTFFDTLAGEVVDFSPTKPPLVTMYTCGPTVYDFAHIGNLRAYVFADTVKRTLTASGYEVKHTINLTDFGHLTDDADAGEDKMMKGLRREGKPITLSAMHDLSDVYIKAFQEDIEALRILSPTTWARASDYVEAQIRLIETLEAKGYTYETADGVYFDIAKFPRYGRLGNIDLTALRQGARVTVNEAKRHPADFAVWKKGLLGWESRWGKGFPGWHIECSAMAITTLGKQIDIHTGGIDHIHTHHNAEIAQSEAATGKTFVRHWLHSAFITIDQTKISKSLGNTITLRHLLERGFSGEDYRYWLLTAHYRSPINFSWDALAGSKQALFRLKRYLYEEWPETGGQPDRAVVERVRAACAADFNTPVALAQLWEFVKDSRFAPADKAATVRALDPLLGLGLADRRSDRVRELGVTPVAELPPEVEALAALRATARAERRFDEADRLREAINLRGYSVEDTPSGQRLRRGP